MIKYYAFLGKTASTGQANKITGRFSNYGRFYAFSSIKKRDAFIRRNTTAYRDHICAACNLKTGRQYAAGQSMRDYLDTMMYVDISE